MDWLFALGAFFGGLGLFFSGVAALTAASAYRDKAAGKDEAERRG